MSQIVAFPTQRYTSGAIFFHWAMALLILFVAVSGLLFDDIPKNIKPWLVNLHAIAGTAILALLIARIWWRIKHRPPPDTASMGRLNRQLSSLGHYALYGLMAIVPVLGLVTLFYRGLGMDFGWFQVGPLLERTPAISRPAGDLHQLTAYALILLALGHIAMAFWHQYVTKDGLLLRMMPATKSPALAAKPVKAAR